MHKRTFNIFDEYMIGVEHVGSNTKFEITCFVYGNDTPPPDFATQYPRGAEYEVWGLYIAPF